MEYEGIKSEIQRYPAVYLYGAGIVAYGACKAIRELFGQTIKGFLVTDKKGQPDELEGIPVCQPGECEDDLSKYLIIIATPEEYQDSIEKELVRLGLWNYIRLDSHAEYVLMGRYLKKTQGVALIEDYKTEEGRICYENVCVYMAVSHKDKSLKRTYREEPWIKKIQVGAALTDMRISELTDEGEESLSALNSLYGELTASYYIWKYNTCKITGLFHYRRILQVTKEQINLLEAGKADVILPLPFVCFPDASGQYGRYLLHQDIGIMHQVLRRHEGRAYEMLEAVLKTPYLYNYNMLIARKEVFDDYCGWIFPVLEEIADKCEKTEEERRPRYIGRIGEVLTSLYFMRNEKAWKIIHAEKIWRV